MDIMAVNDERFGQLERSVSNELARIGPELIRERLEEIDQLPFDGRHDMDAPRYQGWLSDALPKIEYGGCGGV